MAKTKRTKNGTKTAIVVLVLLLAIGFAAVSTTLVINGTIRIGANASDFQTNIKFVNTGLTDVNDANARIDEVTGWNSNTLTFTTTVMNEIGQSAVLTYKVKNDSQYGATLNAISCTATTLADNAENTQNAADFNDYLTVTPSNGLDNTSLAKGATSDAATVTVTQKKSYIGESTKQIKITCTRTADAVEATN